MIRVARTTSAALVGLNVKGLDKHGRPLAIISVNEFGAKGDGIADDSAAIQAALDAANSAGGGWVVASAGTYLVNALHVYANTVLMGAGMGITTFRKTGSEAGEATWIVRLRGDRASLLSCTVDGPGYTGFSGGCVGVTNGAKYTVAEHVEMKNYWMGYNAGGLQNQPALRWDDCSYNTVSHCYVHDVGIMTIGFYAPTAAYGNKIVDCLTFDTHDVSASGCELRNQIGSIISHSYAERVRVGFRFEEKSRDCIISDCVAKDSSLYGFYTLAYSVTGGYPAADETHDCQFQNCTAIGCGNGFLVQNSNRIGMVGCRSRSATSYGFRISGTASGASTNDDCYLQGCIAVASGAAGLRTEVGGNRLSVIGSKFLSNGGSGVEIVTGDNGQIDAFFYDNNPIGLDIKTGRTGWLVEGRAVASATQTRALFDNDRTNSVGDWVPSGHSLADRRNARKSRTHPFQFTGTLASGSAGTVLDVAGKVGVFDYVLPYNSSIVGIAVTAKNARTAGTVTLRPLAQGSAGGMTFTVSLDGTLTQYASVTQGANMATLGAGWRLGCRFETSADFAPATDIVVTVYMEFHD